MAEMKIFNDFSGGLNVKDAPNIIPKHFLTDAENAVIGKGMVSKRHGYERYVSGPIVRTVTWEDVGALKWSEFIG